jgi:Prenyltransferase and squalene oxidase repeat
MTYCAFVVCALLDDWSCIDLPRALSYIQRCRVRRLCPDHHLFSMNERTTNMQSHFRVFLFLSQTYEGGYGQTPLGESLGGPTYCALASMHLVPAEHPYASQARLQPTEWRATVRWLLHTQSQQTQHTEAKLGGGFAGRTNKLADACYGFWCSAALAVRPLSLFRFLHPSSQRQLTHTHTHILRTHDPFPSFLHLAHPCLARSDPWRRSFTRCSRARRVSGKVPIQVWWDWQSARRASW